MYWLCSTAQSMKIEQAGLDGTHRRLLFFDRESSATTLTLDVERQRLYWIFTGQKAISSIDVMGEGLEIFSIPGFFMCDQEKFDKI
ncbi:unnamed protein product [Protopolystoma xenopodis]|uniref:Uncharacterized protein n=1 Tax=Protopolystoma xenopodis TaxID=117903 RepID=A0A3S5AQC6_9PLAT|nr:unnamed protein product [Protopolystoma xenopodis]